MLCPVTRKFDEIDDMNIEKSYRLSLYVAGTIILAVTPFHGIWHWFFPVYEEMEGLSQVQWNIINLFNWAITFFLLFMSLLTLTVARTKSIPLNHLRLFAVFLFGFWVCRLSLEFIFPVQIPFVVIPDPSMFLKILMFAGLIILLTPELSMHIQRDREKERESA